MKPLFLSKHKPNSKLVAGTKASRPSPKRPAPPPDGAGDPLAHIPPLAVKERSGGFRRKPADEPPPKPKQRLKMAATFLPAPRHNYQVHVDEAAPSSLLASAPKQKVPPYGRRQNFVPRAQADYGDGGAFPEIHVAQFPLDMGRPAVKKAAASDGGKGGGGGEGVGGISGLGNNSGSSAIVAVDVDESGKVGLLPRLCFAPACRVCQVWCRYVA